ncbi:MAG: hypothetical protein HQM15_10080 [Deltaproteobacteria bacterium]|nr:hypothetical protein [Deltaproteobacteria bacterium]
MTQGLFSNRAPVFHQSSTPFLSAEENIGVNGAQIEEADWGSLQNLAIFSKNQHLTTQDLAAQRASGLHLRQRVLASQILVAQFSAEAHIQETLQSIIQEALLLTQAGKFSSFEAALAHIQNNLSAESVALFQAFTQSEAGHRTLNFIHQSEAQMSPSSLRILVETARSLAPPSRYLGRVIALGALLSLRAQRGNLPSATGGSPRRPTPRDDIHFIPECLSLGRDFLCETQGALLVWGHRFEYIFIHGLSDNYNHWCDALFSQGAQETAQQTRAGQAETLMQIVQAASSQRADQAMEGALGRQVGLNEMENALGRASILFANNAGDQLSMLSNYTASVASGYLSAVLSRTRFSGYALALAAIGGGVNGAVQAGIGLAHQMGNITSEQVHRNAVPLAWQFLKGVFIGVGSGVSEYAIGGFIHSIPVHNPLLHLGMGVLGFCAGDVGGRSHHH